MAFKEAAVKQRLETTTTVRVVSNQGEDGAMMTEKSTKTTMMATLTATLRGRIDPVCNSSGARRVPQLGVQLEVMRRHDVDEVAVSIVDIFDDDKFMVLGHDWHSVKFRDLLVSPSTVFLGRINLTPDAKRKAAFAAGNEALLDPHQQRLASFPCTVLEDGDFAIQFVMQKTVTHVDPQ